MKDGLLMAVDLGTSFVKAGIYDLQGECIALASEKVDARCPGPGIFLQSGESLTASVERCIGRTAELAKERAKEIQAISFTGQMAGFMGVDREWNDVTGWSCSLDTRYVPYARRQMERLAGEFLGISGTNSPLFSTKYEWFQNEFPQEAKRIAKYMMVSSYVIGKLSEIPVEEATIDGSFLAWTGLADIKNRRWSKTICGQLGISEERLPRIVQSDEIVGYLSERAAKATGLRSGVPLIAGAGDKIAGCVGANILEKGDIIFEAASYAGLSCLVDDFRPDYEKKNFDLLDGAFAGDLYAHYYIPGSGITLEWFLDQFVRTGEERHGALFAKMDEQAAQIAPGCDGLRAVGMLGGTAMPFDGDLKGSWTGFDWSHTKAHFYRALLESFSYAVTTAIERIETLYPEYGKKHVRLIGGGAKSAVWPQMLADVSGRTFERLNREDAALWGACILAAKGVGLIGDVKELAAKHAQVREVFTPEPERWKRYRELKEQYDCEN